MILSRGCRGGWRGGEGLRTLLWRRSMQILSQIWLTSALLGYRWHRPFIGLRISAFCSMHLLIVGGSLRNNSLHLNAYHSYRNGSLNR